MLHGNATKMCSKILLTLAHLGIVNAGSNINILEISNIA
jgi:hypothetical protein